MWKKIENYSFFMLSNNHIKNSRLLNIILNTIFFWQAANQHAFNISFENSES